MISAALAQIIAHCAVRVGPVTMAAIVVYESSAQPYAIGDNTVRHSYFPDDGVRARRLAATLLRAGHNIDVGYAQVNSANFQRLGLDVERAFEPCSNIAAGAAILRAAYARAARAYGPGQLALVHALSAYNTGGYWAGLAYARGVYATASTLQYGAAPLAARRALPNKALRAYPLHRAGEGIWPR